MIWARRLKLLTKFGVAALALGALAACGNAQTVYKGQFTLPFETHWGGTTLPAGDYTFTMSSAISPYTLYIRGEKFNAIVMASAADEKVVSGHAQLNLVDIADVQNVKTFDAPELGLTLSYWTKPTKKLCRRPRPHRRSVKTKQPPSKSAPRVARGRKSCQSPQIPHSEK